MWPEAAAADSKPLPLSKRVTGGGWQEVVQWCRGACGVGRFVAAMSTPKTKAAQCDQMSKWFQGGC